MLATIPARLKQVSAGQTTKKWLANLLRADHRGRETPRSAMRRQENERGSMVVIEGFYLTATSVLTNMARYATSIWQVSVDSNTYEISRAAIAKNFDRLRRFVNDPSGHFRLRDRNGDSFFTPLLSSDLCW